MSRPERPPVDATIALSVGHLKADPQKALRELDRETHDILLLRDAIAIFRQWNAHRLRTPILIESLSALEGRPWTGISQSPHPATELARLLRPLFIRPKNMKFGKEQGKGYQRECFEKALIRFAEIPAPGARWS